MFMQACTLYNAHTLYACKLYSIKYKWIQVNTKLFTTMPNTIFVAEFFAAAPFFQCVSRIAVSQTWHRRATFLYKNRSIDSHMDYLAIFFLLMVQSKCPSPWGLQPLEGHMNPHGFPGSSSTQSSHTGALIFFSKAWLSISFYFTSRMYVCK